jgi:hypothetical protein
LGAPPAVIVVAFATARLSRFSRQRPDEGIAGAEGFRLGLIGAVENEQRAGRVPVRPEQRARRLHHLGMSVEIVEMRRAHGEPRLQQSRLVVADRGENHGGLPLRSRAS